MVSVLYCNGKVGVGCDGYSNVRIRVTLGTFGGVGFVKLRDEL